VSPQTRSRARILPAGLGPAALALATGLVPPLAAAEPPHRVQDELGTPLPAGGRVSPPPPRAMPSGAGLVPLPEQDRVHGLGLVREADGTFGYQDPGHRFRALVRRDGSVLFADRWRRLDHREHLRGRGLGPPPEGARGLNPFVGWRVRGPNEWALALSGSDPAAAAKAGFLARTAAFRQRLAIGFATLQFREGLRALPGQLLAIWTDRSLSAAKRRRLIFQRWDDCHDPLAIPTAVPDATASIDEARARTAAAAREHIEAFVRRHLSTGSTDAFTPDELRRLNRTRKSPTAFAPYETSPR
jgi:hypothetical protein